MAEQRIDDPAKKKKPTFDVAWREARELMWQRRGRLGLGLLLMTIGRLCGLVLPASSKILIDKVIGQHRADLLWPLALAAGAATLIQASTGFLLSLVLGVTAQRSITEMRRSVEEHVAAADPYFDSTKTGVLISRIMTDAEGIRNLVGTGLVELIGGIVTAALRWAILFWLNWQLTSITIVDARRVRRHDGVAFSACARFSGSAARSMRK